MIIRIFSLFFVTFVAMGSDIPDGKKPTKKSVTFAKYDVTGAYFYPPEGDDYCYEAPDQVTKLMSQINDGVIVPKSPDQKTARENALALQNQLYLKKKTPSLTFSLLPDQKATESPAAQSHDPLDSPRATDLTAALSPNGTFSPAASPDEGSFERLMPKHTSQSLPLPKGDD